MFILLTPALLALQAPQFTGYCNVRAHEPGLGPAVNWVQIQSMPDDGTAMPLSAQQQQNSIAASVQHWSDDASYDRVFVSYSTIVDSHSSPGGIATLFGSGVQQGGQYYVEFAVAAGESAVLRIDSACVLTAAPSGQGTLLHRFELLRNGQQVFMELESGGPALAFDSWSVVGPGSYRVAFTLQHFVPYWPLGAGRSNGSLLLELKRVAGQHYGSACSTGTAPSLAVSGDAVPNAQLSIAVASQPNERVFLVVGRQSAQVPLRSGCTLLVEPSTFEFIDAKVAPALGSASITTGFEFTVPASAGVGDEYVFQALLLAPGPLPTSQPITRVPFGRVIAATDAVRVTL